MYSTLYYGSSAKYIITCARLYKSFLEFFCFSFQCIFFFSRPRRGFLNGKLYKSFNLGSLPKNESGAFTFKNWIEAVKCKEWTVCKLLNLISSDISAGNLEGAGSFLQSTYSCQDSKEIQMAFQKGLSREDQLENKALHWHLYKVSFR